MATTHTPDYFRIDGAGRMIEQTPFLVADDRPEHEPCQAGTVGCCVDHSGPEHGCETW